MSQTSAETLVQLLNERAERAPRRRAYVYLHDDGQQQSLDYGELLVRARAVASVLQRERDTGGRALLLYPPGLDFVVALLGCVLAGVVAVPAYPPEPARLERTLSRLRAIAADADVTWVLTTSLVRTLADSLAAHAPELARRRWIATDVAEATSHATFRDSDVAPDDVALLQYTSGSTADPRGVMVTHRNVLHNSAAIQRLAQHDAASVYVCWLPTYHDMGLIGGVLQPLYGEFLGVLMSPSAFLQSPLRWLQALTQFGGTTTPFPNFALDHCVRRVGAAERQALDLSALRVACNGAEPVRWESLQRFTQAFEPCGFRADAHYPAYGLAEATLLVSGRPPGTALRALSVDRAALAEGRVERCSLLTRTDGSELRDVGTSDTLLVGCGRSLPDQEILIVDPETLRPVVPDRVGEIWVRGPSVAGGYFRRPHETAETFGARLADGAGPYLRTGDLGFLRDEELYVTGRRKDLIILRGRNLYPQDVERTAERSHAQLRPGGVAAFALDLDGEERLAVAAELDTRRGAVDREAVWAALTDAIAREHEATLALAVLLPASSLPKTSSGKLQRRACRDALRANTLPILHRFSAPAAPSPKGEPAARAPLRADCAALYDTLHSRIARLERRSTRYQYDLERDIPWHRLHEPGLHAGPTLLGSERIDLSSLENTEAGALLQWTLAVNVCDRFTALEEAVLRFTAEERVALGETRSVELLDAEEQKHIVMFRRYGEHLRSLRPELAADADRYLAVCRERLRETHQRFTDPLERHYANWILLVFFEEYSLFIYRELLRDAPRLQPVWLAIHRAHAREEAQHVQTDAAYLAALRLSEEQRYAWSRRLFDTIASDFSVLFALFGEHALRLCQRLLPEFKGRGLVQNGTSSVLPTLLADKAFSETRAAAPYFAFVAARPLPPKAQPAPSEEALATRSWLRDWLAREASIDANRIDPRRSFPSYGLDSVRLIALSGDLARFSGRRISPTAAYDYPSIELLAEHALAAPGVVRVPPLSRPGPLPLSARQLRLVALEAAHPRQILDHLTEVFALAPIGEEVVLGALVRLSERHEALRCHIADGSAGPSQFAPATLATFPFRVVSAAARDDASFDDAVRALALAQDRVPFELSGPLFRATLVRGPDERRALLVTLHHLIGDGWSMALLRRDLASLLQSALGREAAPLPALPRQPADVAARERAFLRSDAGNAALRFWSERLADHPRLRAPLPRLMFHGAVLRRPFPRASINRLTALAQKLGVTPYIAFLTAFCRVLQRRSGQDDVLVNTHLFNRADEEERALMGYFVNVLTIRAELPTRLAFADAVRRVHVAWMEALEHALPIDEIVRALRPEAYRERYMPAASAFNMLPAFPEGARVAGAPIEPRPELAPPPGFMFFEQMLLVAPDPHGTYWLTLWFNEAVVPESEATELLAELSLVIERLSSDLGADRESGTPAVRAEIVRATGRRFVSDHLGLAPESITDELSLLRLGLDSVLAAELAGALEAALGSPVDASAVFRHRTLDGLAQALSGVDSHLEPAISSCDPGPLSCSELGLFQLLTRDPGPQTAYNLLLRLRINAPPDAPRLRSALALLSARHEALRTGFYTGADGTPRRRVAASAPVTLVVHRVPPSELAAACRTEADALRERSFELSEPPLFRAVLLDAGSEGALLFSFNHLIVDASALSVLQRELAIIWRALGRGESPRLPPLLLGASEYGSALHARLAPIFECGPAAFPGWPAEGYRLPLDTPRPAAPKREGTILRRCIDPALLARVRSAAARAEVPASAALVAAFQYALHRHATRGDVAFTLVRSGRSARALRNLVAYLSYGDTVEGRLAPTDTWGALLERAARVVLDENVERMPYNLLVQPPSMRVVLNIHNFANPPDETAPFHYEHENRHAELWPVWDLFFQILSVDAGLSIEILYRDEVLRLETIEQIGRHFEVALTDIAENISSPVGPF